MMKITLIGSLGHINRYTIPALVAQGHDVTVITSSQDRVAEIEALGAQAAVGSIFDVAFLTKAFTSADAVYLMVTAFLGEETAYDAATKLATIYKQALANAQVKRIVNLSSIGADQGDEVGVLHIYNIIEGILATLPDVTITNVRAVGFFSNMYGNLATIKAQHAIVHNYADTVETGWTDPKDISAAIVTALNDPQPTNGVHYVISQWLTGQEIVAAFADALNIPDLHWVQISDDQLRAGMLQSGASEDAAQGFTLMGAAQRNEAFYADLRKAAPVLGTVKLTDILPGLVAAYQK
ncbi:SDR family oxidoreductase [Secundilactobacillus paracollinoides]|nr:NAD(P)H-binding protein [Secundilactobacillus paracollinoides]